QPLEFALNLPDDLATALDGVDRYGPLFQAAFGDETITPTRIAFAIATYERTLIPNQTPYDRFLAGDDDALTLRQRVGLNVINNNNCSLCHIPPTFSASTFHNIGLRPSTEDIGRAQVTGLAADNGKMRVPTLRNAGLKPRMMHTGEFEQLETVATFYLPSTLKNQDNLDPLVPVDFSPLNVDAVGDFIRNGLKDPRVAAGEPPFDAPTLLAAGAISHNTPNTEVVPIPFWATVTLGLLMALIAAMRIHSLRNGRQTDD
ncbi:MAG: cytochrome c peroxidase, partial [Pseudomonadota bacterium]